MTEKNIIAQEAKCFKCGAIWNVSLLATDATSVRCEMCGGYVVSPSGKAQVRPVYEGEEITSPLIDPKTYERRQKRKATVEKASGKNYYRDEDIPRVVDLKNFQHKKNNDILGR